MLAEYFQNSDNLERRAEEWPHQLLCLDDIFHLSAALSQWSVFDRLYHEEYSSQLLAYWRKVSYFCLSSVFCLFSFHCPTVALSSFVGSSCAHTDIGVQVLATNSFCVFSLNSHKTGILCLVASHYSVHLKPLQQLTKAMPVTKINEK